jgi:hypothetical protein
MATVVTFSPLHGVSGVMPIETVLAEFERLKSEGLIENYAVGGAVAANTYIEAHMTEDVDVFVVFSDSKASELVSLGPVWSNLVVNGAKQNGIYLEIGGWKVQLLAAGKPVFDDAIANAEEKVIDNGNAKARIITPKYLAPLALERGEPKDYSRIEQFIKTGLVTREEVEQSAARYNLMDRWNTFRRRFLDER